MVGITLTPEQIRSAPVEVRRWIEREIAASLGLRAPEANLEQPRREHLVVLKPDEAIKVLSLIQNMFPVVNVFFELGRHGASLGHEELEAFRLLDILQHTRLANISQVIGCLDIVNEAVRRVRQDTGATLYVLDKRGECIVAAETQHSIARLWTQVASGAELPGAEAGQGTGAAGEAGAIPKYGHDLEGLAGSTALQGSKDFGGAGEQ